MWELLGTVSIWLKLLGIDVPAGRSQPLPPLQTFKINALLPQDAKAKNAIDQYLQRLQQKGFSSAQQGVWVQSDLRLLGSHIGDQPLPAASLTKVATSLAALQTWPPDHRFLTRVFATGPIVNGVLQGDLVIQGGGDPLFVWEEAFHLGNVLNQLGIRQVTGQLVVTGFFAMNFESDPRKSAALLLEALDSRRWSASAQAQFASLKSPPAKPQVAIAGGVVLMPQAVDQQQALVIHRSLPLSVLIKQMNTYSNNAMSEMLASMVGGAAEVANRAAVAAGVPPSEVQLLNGSGLNPQNRLSPRTVCGLFQAIQYRIQPAGLNLADLFPVSGRDRGTIEDRRMPSNAVVKTGTLWNVSTLSGIIPTRDQGTVWFSIMNLGENLDGFRDQQDQLLQALTKIWGSPTVAPQAFSPKPTPERIGDPSRNQVVSAATK
jgi:serine-type D-Ala-D-Ala carboxypeptidase/endopeptidase (penicillin-binding protein 4)